jgi:hypothetical protein
MDLIRVYKSIIREMQQTEEERILNLVGGLDG